MGEAEADASIVGSVLGLLEDGGNVGAISDEGDVVGAEVGVNVGANEGAPVGDFVSLIFVGDRVVGEEVGEAEVGEELGGRVVGDRVGDPDVIVGAIEPVGEVLGDKVDAVGALVSEEGASEGNVGSKLGA